MIPYRINEAQLSIAPEWEDQSLQVFKLPAAPGGKPASFVVSRDLSRKNHPDFSAYIDQQRSQLKEKLPEFKLLKDEKIQYQNHAGVWWEYTWTNGEHPLYIRQVFYDRPPLALIFTMSASPEDNAHFEQTWRRTMSATVLEPLTPLAQEAPFPPPESLLQERES